MFLEPVLTPVQKPEAGKPGKPDEPGNGFKRGEQPRCITRFEVSGKARVCNHPDSFHTYSPRLRRIACRAMGCRCPGLSTPE
jgi:hypothetical protein